MNRNHVSIVIIGLIFLSLTISNLYFVKKTFELNEQLELIMS